MNAESQYAEDRLGDLLPASGWAVVYLEGEKDVPSAWLADGSDWRSWNGAGTTGSPGALGATCSASAARVPCYESCGTCTDRCWWTTCRDDVAFVASVMASLPCATRFAATGFSNGAIFLYELSSRPETAPLSTVFSATLASHFISELAALPIRFPMFELFEFWVVWNRRACVLSEMYNSGLTL